MKNTLLTIGILLLLIANGYQYWTCKDCPQETIIKTRTDTIHTIETVYLDDVIIPKPKTIQVTTHQLDTLWLPGDTLILEIRDTIIQENLNIYRDTITVQLGKEDTERSRRGVEPSIMYEHLVRGELLSSQYRLIVPFTTINSQNRTYIREFEHQLFATTGVVTNEAFFDVALGAQYINKENGIHYQYAVGQNIHSFTFLRRIFRR